MVVTLIPRISFTSISIDKITTLLYYILSNNFMTHNKMDTNTQTHSILWPTTLFNQFLFIGICSFILRRHNTMCPISSQSIKFRSGQKALNLRQLTDMGFLPVCLLIIFPEYE